MRVEEREGENIRMDWNDIVVTGKRGRREREGETKKKKTTFEKRGTSHEMLDGTKES